MVRQFLKSLNGGAPVLLCRQNIILCNVYMCENSKEENGIWNFMFFHGNECMIGVEERRWNGCMYMLWCEVRLLHISNFWIGQIQELHYRWRHLHHHFSLLLLPIISILITCIVCMDKIFVSFIHYVLETWWPSLPWLEGFFSFLFIFLKILKSPIILILKNWKK